MQLANIEGIKLENRISINGRNLGQRLAFNVHGTPSQMRETYRSAGLKGNALSSAVRDAVKAGKDIAWVQFHALTQMAQNGDFIPTSGDMNSKGDKIKLELVKPIEPKRKAEKPAVDPEQAVADRMGISVEALRKLYIKK
jgi:hypothetical protein